MVDSLLPTRALRGHRIGISVSDSADLARLGLTPVHLKLAVRELARTVLVGGGTLAYGGHLKPGGFTEFLIGELGQYAGTGVLDADGVRQVALLLCLSQQEHQKCSLTELQATDDDLGLYGELRCLDLNGTVLVNRAAGRGPDGKPYPTDKAVLAQGLSAMRQHMLDSTDARMLIGGRRHGYSGAMPGLYEEALLTLQAGQPMYLAAGFGGATLDLAGAIDARCTGLCARHAGDPPLESGASTGLAAFSSLIGNAGWARLDNGLSDNENLHLATTHRPGEIASLVGLGLGRWAARS